jgi:hypothetical protein
LSNLILGPGLLVWRRATIRRAVVMSDVTIVGEDEADPRLIDCSTAPLAG